MPQINLQIIGSEPSEDQKRALISKLTDLMVNVLGRTRKLVVISLTTTSPSDWGFGGEPRQLSGFVGAQAVIRVLAGTNSDAQKETMVAEVNGVVRDILGETQVPLYVTFEQVPATDWGYNGKTIAAFSAGKAA